MNQKVIRFEDLNIWNEGLSLSVSIYEELENCKDFSLRDQMKRASVSIPSNIAEGFERNKIKILYVFCITLSPLLPNYVHSSTSAEKSDCCHETPAIN